ncbi:hypothetical protein Tco_0308600 [Tanacetum coccineum]
MPSRPTSLSVVSNPKCRAFVYSFPLGLININPAPELSELEAPSKASRWRSPSISVFSVSAFPKLNVMLS